MADKEKMPIAKCPLCEKPHVYTLEVKRAHYLGLAQAFTPPPEVRSFPRFFHCPEKDQDFQAIVRLLEYENSPIESVSVVGLAGD